jgi:CDP-glycerol glycerophosphotransferase (TagB/SpsB family)
MILIVKMHPTDDIVPNLYLELVPPQLSDSILIVRPDVPGLDVYALLDCCDLFITRASTVAEDALVMGKRVIAFDLMESGPSKHYKHLEEYELYETVYAAPKTALREAVLSSLCSDSKPQRSGRVEDDITYCLDGRSTERAASEIVTELFGEPSPHAF